MRRGQIKVRDFPKLHSPFVRNESSDYKVVDIVPENMAWVFNDDDVICCEKLHGTNVAVRIVNGTVVDVWNRGKEVYQYSKDSTCHYIIEGIWGAQRKGYLSNLDDGFHFGELVGEKFHGNPYDLDGHVWLPFDRVREVCRYKSWGRYPKDYDSISEWFKEDLLPLFYCRMNGISFNDLSEDEGYVEGVIFYHPITGKMAKLRRDMFEWYKGEAHAHI